MLKETAPRYEGTNHCDDDESYWKNWVEMNEGSMDEEETEDDILYEKLKNMNLMEEMERKDLERMERMKTIKVEVENMKENTKLNKENEKRKLRDMEVFDKNDEDKEFKKAHDFTFK